MTLASLAPAARAAESTPVQLNWRAPDSADCPQSAEVVREIQRYVGDAPSRAPIEASATVESVGPGRWQLVLATKDGDAQGERTLQGESCRAVADAAVVVLAWMVDPNAMANHLNPPAQERPVPPTPAPTRAPEPTPHRRRSTVFLGAGLAGDVGSLPAPALGAGVWGGMSLGRFRLAVRGAYWPSRKKTIATLSEGRAAGASFTLRLLGLETCVQAWPNRVDSRSALLVCAGPELDQVHGAGFGVNATGAGSKLWLAFFGGIAGHVSLTPGVRLVGGLFGVVPTEREHFALRGVGEVYRPAVLAVRASLGLEFAFQP